MRRSKQKVIEIALGIIGLLFGAGATLFKVAAKLIGIEPDGPRGWALRLSTAQLILAACLIILGCFLVAASRDRTQDQG